MAALAAALLRARKFEESLNTKARIYVKYEGVSPVGSHKTNSAVAQAYYNHVDGVTKLTTETGAGSGAVRWHSRARSSESTSRCGRSAPPTIQSPTAGT